jgi:predicted nucleic-acid-binding Zn-ribbon protein
MGRRLTFEQFIEKSNEIHNNKYDYSLVCYKNNFTKVKIICSEHGIFEQTPSNHIHSKQGCPKCYGNKKITLDEFIKTAAIIHDDKYDYSLVDYKNNFTKVKIICPEHGIFEQKPNGHLIQKSGCLKCSGKNTKTTEEFISFAKSVHVDLYDYSLVDYVSGNIKVKIICKKHGIFEQKPDIHTNRRHGCPKCRKSKGELQIIKTLNENKILFVQQKEFEDCKDKNALYYDFYLPDHNLCIEYDGLQHFEPIEFWGGVENLEYIQKHDQIKTDFCVDNDIKLIRIKYNRKLKDSDILEKIYCYD